MPEALAKSMAEWGERVIDEARSGEYGGVFMLFPGTIVTAGPTQLSVSRLVGVAPDVSRLSVRIRRRGSGWTWPHREKPVEELPGYDPGDGLFRLARLERHPLETGDFHWEDVWVCEKLQRSLHSPAYRFGPFAAGAGAEAPLEFFQRNVLDFVTAGP